LTLLRLCRDDKFQAGNRLSPSPIRVLTFLESSTVTGPAKNLIEFATRARQAADGQRPFRFEAAAYVRDGAGESNAYIAALRAAEIPVHVIRERRVGDLGALRRLGEVIDSVRPDVIQTHNCKSHLFVRLSERWRRVPWIGFHHGYTTTSLKTRVYNQFDRFSLRRAIRMVTVCQPFVRQLSGFGIDAAKISVVHNSVKECAPPDPETVEAVRRCHGIHAGRPVVLSVGRLSHEKAQRDLIEAMAILSLEMKDAAPQLILVGDGPELSSLRQQAARAGLDGSVAFCGQQSDVRPYFAMAGAFALPSLSEGSPNALLEAMAAGVPSVASNVGGVPEIATDRETALLVPPAKPAELAGALRKILTEPAGAAAMAERARHRVLTDFSPKAQTLALRRVYESVLLSA
jgi:glycosyltransferase involved in cell wall biosynthesis